MGGWTNNPKTNVQRVESWSSKQTLINKLNRIYRQLCCIINDEHKIHYVERDITNLEITTLFDLPVTIVPAAGVGTMIDPVNALISFQLNGGTAPAVTANDDIILTEQGSAGILQTVWPWRNALATSVDRTLSTSAHTGLLVAGTQTQILENEPLKLAVGTLPTANPIMAPGNAITMTVRVWYRIVNI